MGPDVVVMLLPARTDTRYFHEWCVRGEVRLLPGRLRFLAEGRQLDAAPFPSMVVIWRRSGIHSPVIRAWDWRSP